MYSRCWLVIRDDSKRTFDVCGQSSDTNHFTNATHAMQKAGMNVSCSTPNVTNKNASKEAIKIAGYVKEDGLHERLQKEYAAIARSGVEDW